MFQLSEQGRSIREMFDGIASRYDILNRCLSLGIDRRWRAFAAKQLRAPERGVVLDMATGTGDVALEIASRTSESVLVIGEDFTNGMLAIAQKKIAASPFHKRIFLVNAPCEAIPHSDRSFDGITIAFGMRNMIDRLAGLREMRRVLKPGGRLVILEFSNPRSRIVKIPYNLYFQLILPVLGGLFSQRRAYEYLPDSVRAFPTQEAFKGVLHETGFKELEHFDLTFGVATVYVGVAPD